MNTKMNRDGIHTIGFIGCKISLSDGDYRYANKGVPCQVNIWRQPAEIGDLLDPPPHGYVNFFSSNKVKL